MDGLYDLCHVVPLQPEPEGSLAGCNTTAQIKTTYKVEGVGSARCQGVVAKAVGGL